MPAKVVDASALAALLFGEPAAAEVARELGEARLVAPTLLRYEIASVAKRKRERHAKEGARILEALDLLAQLDLDEVEVPAAAMLRIAEAAALTTYDAAYLWLARELALPLVTLDRRLAAVAARIL